MWLLERAEVDEEKREKRARCPALYCSMVHGSTQPFMLALVSLARWRFVLTKERETGQRENAHGRCKDQSGEKRDRP